MTTEPIISADPADAIDLSLIESIDVEILLRRKTYLDSTLMALGMAGLPSDAALENEFLAVQNELNRRRVPFPALHDDRAWTNWLGKTINGFKIQYLIEEGLYWFQFFADSESGEQAVLKIAKEVERYGIATGVVPRPTRLFAIDGDIVREVRPGQNTFLQAEIQRLGALASEQLPELPLIQEVGSVGIASGAPAVQYMRRAFLSGDRLADLLQYGTGRHQSFEIVSMFSQIASTLADMLSNEGFIYHGNLKPENIIFTAGGIYFRELGDFCSIVCGDVPEPEVRITTPQYYPWLDVDDVGALGACLWEALTDCHPFDDTRAAEGDCILAADMRALIDFELSLANMFVLPLLNIKRPHQLGVNTSEKLEALLFKSIKMRVGEDGLIHEDAGYASMAEFSHALLDLLNEPTMIF